MLFMMLNNSFFLMILLLPISTRTDTPIPYTTLFQSLPQAIEECQPHLTHGIKQGLIRTRYAGKKFTPGVTGDDACIGVIPCGRDCHDNGINHGLGRIRFFTQNRDDNADVIARSEEHTSELQSLMRISYAVFCLKKKKQ